MATGERRAWITALVTVVAYTVYLLMVTGRAGGGPLTEADYAPVLLWSIGGAIAATVVLDAVTAAVRPGEGTRTDVRDREIGRLGDQVGQSFLVVGGVAVLALAVAEADHFWIAQTIYLAFVLSALLSSATRIVSYRLGLGPW
ncbi:hypothetical protein ABZ714_02925 [Streptomyces sp. NPDC006798]|uniref:hypothetical protein n=1 Tax=Streptomyces sp. NPDC006798 TaxID=3155462 RepID=UPI0033CD73F4